MRSTLSVRAATLKRAVFAGLLVLSAAAVHGARCGHLVIAQGDHQFDVLQRCGEPDYAATRLVYPLRRFAADGPGEGSGVVQIIDFPTLIEEWVYEGGAGHFAQLLRFSNGRLIDIESLAKRPSRR